MARPPSSLPPSGDALLQVSLILGSFVHDPLKAHLFDLSIPPSAPPPQHPDEPSFHLRPELHHTFRPEPKLPYAVISLAFTGVVVAPWAVLLFMVSSFFVLQHTPPRSNVPRLQLSHVPHRLPYLSSPQVLTFVSLLAAFEGLLLWYWLALRLGQVLAYGAALGSVTVFAGKSALQTLAKLRVDGSPK